MKDKDWCDTCREVWTSEQCETCQYGWGKKNNYKPMTNADRIRGMTDEELAKKIAALMACMECPLLEMCERAEPRRCIDMWLDWLKAPVEEAE